MENNPVASESLGGTTISVGVHTATPEYRRSYEPTVSDTQQIGISRPPLLNADLPNPETVFKARRIGLEELFLLVLRTQPRRPCRVHRFR